MKIRTTKKVKKKRRAKTTREKSILRRKKATMRITMNMKKKEVALDSHCQTSFSSAALCSCSSSIKFAS